MLLIIQFFPRGCTGLLCRFGMFLGDRRRARLSIASINGLIRTARGCETVALSPSICSAPTGRGGTPQVCATREDPPSTSRRRIFVHSWLRHRNNSTAIFLALCRVSVTNGSFSKRREATRENLAHIGKFTRFYALASKLINKGADSRKCTLVRLRLEHADVCE